MARSQRKSFCREDLFFFSLYFTDYAISCPNVPPLPPYAQHPPSLRQSPPYGSCPWVMCASSLAAPFPVLYFTSPWLFCNCLFVLLNPLTSSPVPPIFNRDSLGAGRCPLQMTKPRDKQFKKGSSPHRGRRIKSGGHNPRAVAVQGLTPAPRVTGSEEGYMTMPPEPSDLTPDTSQYMAAQ